MTTAPVHTITDEQIVEIEKAAKDKKAEGFLLTHNLSCDNLIALVARLREAEKDAARYKFLRNTGKFSPSAFGDGWALNCGYTRAQPIELDRAVDDAMQEHKQ